MQFLFSRIAQVLNRISVFLYLIGLGQCLLSLDPELASTCRLEASLSTLAAKNFSIKELLEAPSRPRLCLAHDSPISILSRPLRLAYVTPWNTAGYAYTRLHSEKLTHVAPVWYQVTLNDNSVVLSGQDAINQGWLKDIRSSGQTKIVPRFEVKFAAKADVEAILFFPRKEADKIVASIVKEVETSGYDGATLEVIYTAQMTSLIKKLGNALHQKGKEMVLVIPAHHDARQPSPFSHDNLQQLQDHVDLFSLNAYDHASSLGQEAGNAPIDWTIDILDALFGVPDQDKDDPWNDLAAIDTRSKEDSSRQLSIRSKVLLGINFYGHTLTKDSVLNTITASEYTSLLEFSLITLPMHVTWDAQKAEHRLDAKLWSIWYPTLLSLLYRVDLAREYGIGLSIWDAGQGLDHFWDVL